MGFPGEVADELGLVHGDVLDTHGPFHGFQFNDPVHQQHGVPVGQNLLDFLNV